MRAYEIMAMRGEMLVMDRQYRPQWVSTDDIKTGHHMMGARGNMINEASNQQKPIRYRGKKGFTRDRAVEL